MHESKGVAKYSFPWLVGTTNTPTPIVTSGVETTIATTDTTTLTTSAENSINDTAKTTNCDESKTATATAIGNPTTTVVDNPAATPLTNTTDPLAKNSSDSTVDGPPGANDDDSPNVTVNNAPVFSVNIAPSTADTTTIVISIEKPMNDAVERQITNAIGRPPTVSETTTIVTSDECPSEPTVDGSIITTIEYTTAPHSEYSVTTSLESIIDTTIANPIINGAEATPFTLVKSALATTVEYPVNVPEAHDFEQKVAASSNIQNRANNYGLIDEKSLILGYLRNDISLTTNSCLKSNILRHRICDKFANAWSDFSNDEVPSDISALDIDEGFSPPSATSEIDEDVNSPFMVANYPLLDHKTTSGFSFLRRTWTVVKGSMQKCFKVLDTNFTTATKNNDVNEINESEDAKCVNDKQFEDSMSLDCKYPGEDEERISTSHLKRALELFSLHASKQVLSLGTKYDVFPDWENVVSAVDVRGEKHGGELDSQ